MTYISRAQNFEDYRLYRALKHVELGNYIDVGAWDPEYHSVSYNFYEKGWRGVNVDADEASFQKLSLNRPLDLNFNHFVSSKLGVMEFITVSNSGLSTGNKLIATKLKNDSTFRTSVHKIQCVTLNSIFNRLESKVVHWLKIDTEGSEFEVLESWGTSLSRPWIVIVEATTPGSPELSQNEWEKFLFERDYIYAYFDGLNKFYVHQDQKELIRSIQSPISIFDDVITFENHLRCYALEQLSASLETDSIRLKENFIGQPKIDLLAAEIQKLVATKHDLSMEITKCNNMINHYQDLLQSTQNSLSESQSELARIKNSKAYRIIRPLLSLYSRLLNISKTASYRTILLKVVARLVSNKKIKIFLIKNLSPRIISKVRNKIYFSNSSLNFPKDDSALDLPMLEMEQLLEDFRNR